LDAHSALLNQHTFANNDGEPSCINCDATLKDFVEKSCLTPHRYEHIIELEHSTSRPKVLECVCGDRVSVTPLDKHNHNKVD
jgi:hypothetical protein